MSSGSTSVGDQTSYDDSLARNSRTFWTQKFKIKSLEIGLVFLKFKDLKVKFNET